MRNSFESFQAVKAADRHVPVYGGEVPQHIIERSEAAKTRATGIVRYHVETPA